MTPLDIHTTPAFTLPNLYRIGDSVAVMLLREFIEKHTTWESQLSWFIEHPNATLNMLARFLPDGPADQYYMLADESACPIQSRVAHRYAISHALKLDDIGKHPDGLFIGSLWVWNHVFHQIGHRLNLEPSGMHRTALPWRAVFCPLYQADYSTERVMHPAFAADVAEALAKDYGAEAVMILPDWPGYHDFIQFKDIPMTQVRAPLAECVSIIGDAEMYIGGDTGLSHIAGMFPRVRQIGLHDRGNLARHIEREFDHMGRHREAVIGVCAALDVAIDDCEYRSFPNKQGMADILFDAHGHDGVAAGLVVEAIAAQRAAMEADAEAGDRAALLQETNAETNAD